MNPSPDIFLNIKLPSSPQEGDTERPADTPLTQAGRSTPLSGVQQKYELAIKRVNKHFPHLALDEIFYPPKGRFDALLARQIALYLMVNELAVSRRQLSLELERSRGRLAEVIQKVEARREITEFDRVYRQIAAEVKEDIRKSRGVMDDG